MKTYQKNNFSLITKIIVPLLVLSFVLVSGCQDNVDPTETDTVKPEAAFTYTAAELVVTYVNTSKGADTYAWDFGDGQTSDVEEPPTITYASAGSYDVKLSVTRANGQKHELVRQVTVRKTPVAAFSATSVGRVTTFVNESANADTYEWNFGDASALSTEESPVHEFPRNETYSVKLIAIKGALRDEITMDVSVVGPTAEFEFTLNDKTLSLTNLSTDATSYKWDLGDGTLSTDETPADHTYTDYGTYNVELVAIADDTATDTLTLEVAVVPLPTAKFSYSGTALAFTFTNESTDAATYIWDFGDGNTSTDENPTNNYSAAGTYMVSLTAVNEFGFEDVALQWFGVHGTGAAYATFINGNLDGYGLNAERDDQGCTEDCITSADYQKNNDAWEDPDHWTGIIFDRAGGMSSDGKKLADGSKTNGLKMANNNTRGGYQEVVVETGQSYTVTFDVAGDVVAGTNVRLDAYVLNARIFKEDDPVAGNTEAHFPINDTELTGKGNFITKSITFTATTDLVTFYMLETIHTNNSSSEVWVDNITLTKN